MMKQNCTKDYGAWEKQREKQNENNIAITPLKPDSIGHLATDGQS
jgi:hypothetical protein